MTRSIPAALVLLALFSACAPKFSEVTLTGAPLCPNSKLSSEVVLKVEGPRVSLMQRLNGTQATVDAKLEQGKAYTVKAYRCVAEPCEAPANLFSEQKLTAPETPTGTLALELKNAPECVALAPPAPAATEDAGAPAP